MRIGGVDLYVKSSDCLHYKTGCTGESLDYDDTWGHLHIHLKEGMQHLNGDQAVAYMRFRHDWCSDPCRIMRQQQVLRALADKVKGDRVNTLPASRRSAGRLPEVRADRLHQLRAALASHVLSRHQPRHRSSAIKCRTPTTSICRATATRSFPTRRARDAAGRADADAAARADRLARRDGARRDSASTLRVDVENGSGVSGAARRVADLLKHAGFTIGAGQRCRIAPTTARPRSTNIRASTFAGARVREALAGARCTKRRSFPIPRRAASPAADRDRANRQRRDGDRRHRLGASRTLASQDHS